jgi:hypothetical protein
MAGLAAGLTPTTDETIGLVCALPMMRPETLNILYALR